MHKVLVVDDEQRTLDGVAQRVRNSGFDVEIVGLARDGLEALELTRIHNPGIVLCDIRIPGMNGIAFTLKAKEIDPDVAVIFMSGYSDREYLKTAIRIGAIDYLDKPVDEDQFLDALGRAIRRREEVAGLPAKSALSQETLRLLLTSNNEDIVRSLPGISLNVRADYVVVVAMLYHHESTDDTEQQFNMFTLHMISSFSEDRQYRYTAVRMGSQIVLLIKDERSGAGETLEKRVAELADALLSELPEARERISIGIGCRFNRLSDTSHSYRMACETLDLAFFRGVGSVIRHGDFKGGQYEFNESQLHDINTFCECSELLRVTDAVDRLYCRILENERTPVHQVKSITLKICQILARNYEKDFLTSLLDNPAGLQNAVMTAFTVEQLFGVLRQLIAKYTYTILTKDKKAGAIYSAKKYIWNHLADEVSVKSIAGAVYLTPTYLCALFKEVTGITINQYVQQARIDKARSLLANTNRTVNEIAELVGYKSIGYFNRVFHQHTGLAPANYRKKQFDV